MTPCLFVAAFVAAFAAAPRPEMLPHPTVYQMASRARAIVEGTVDKEGVVRITRRFLVPDGEQIGASIRVPSLSAMPKRVQNVGAAAGDPIRPDSVLLFLAERTHDDVWEPMHLIRGVARGAIWFEGDAAWGYAQWINPGPYALCRWLVPQGADRVRAVPKELRQITERAVAAREKWQETLQVEGAERRAAALARWFSPSTSPDGKWWRGRVWPELLQASDALGAQMARPLGKVVQVDVDPDAVATAADALGRLGARGREATPSLIARLRDLRGAQPIFLVRALRRLADPRAEHVLRDLMKHEDLFVVAEAGAALHAAGLDGVVPLLVAGFPDSITTPVRRSAVATMLGLLYELEPARAERLVVDRYLDDEQLMMQRPWLRRLRRR